MAPPCFFCLTALHPGGMRAAGGEQAPCYACRARRGAFGRAPAMAGPSGAPPTQRSGLRPRAPEVELSQGEVNVTFSRRDEPTPDPDLPLVHADGPAESQPEPLSLRDVEVQSSPLREVTASRRLFDLLSLPDGPDGEAVSLADLQAVFSPGHNPSPRLGTLAPPPLPAVTSPVPPSAEIEGTTAPLPPVALRRVTFDEEPEGDAPPLLLREKRRPAPPPAPRSLPHDARIAPPPPPSSPEMPISSDARQPISSGSIEPISSGSIEPISSSALEPVSSEPAQPVSDGSILASSEPAVDVDFSGIDETRPSPAEEKARPAKAAPAKHARLPFFDTGSLPPLHAPDLYEAAPAPFDPSVPPLPPARISESPNSGLTDIRALALEAGAAEPTRRTDYDLFNLSGGIFDESHGNLGPPDPHRLALPARSLRPSRPSLPPSSQRPIAPVLTPSSPSSAPVVSERAPRPSSSRKASRAALILALGALSALVAVGVNRWAAQSGERAEPAPPVKESAGLPVLTAAAPPPPTAPAPPRAAEIPAIDPLAPPAKSSAPAPTASALALAPTAAPTAPTTREAPTREPPPEKAPPPEKTAAAVEKPAPTVVEMPPAPAGGAEFDKAAAKVALASAASRASVCKTPDDPGGGAKVSVTFAPSGRVTTSRVTGAPYQGTTIGGCIAAAFRSASVPPFDGPPVTVSRDVNLH